MIFGLKKERLNIDEVFTYEGSKAGAVGCVYWDRTENFYGSWHTGSELIQDITLEEGEKWVLLRALGESRGFRGKDLYYLIVNTAESIFEKGFSMWPVIICNLFLVIMAELLMVNLIRDSFENYTAAVMCLFMFALSAGGISVVLYQRAYALTICLNSLAMTLLYRHYKEDNRIKRFILLLVLAIVGWLIYRAHLFGFLLFFCLFLGYLLYEYVIRKKRYVAFGTTGLLMLFIGIILVQRHKSQFIIALNRLASLHIRGMVNSTLGMLRILADHLYFSNVLLAGMIVADIIFSRRAGEKGKKTVLIISGVSLCAYYSIMILTLNTHWWKYLSPAYLLTVSFICLMLLGHDDKPHIRACKCAVIAVATLLTLTNVSELFIGEKEEESFFETNYATVNGMFVHADTAGENYLYDAAFLWPDGTRVYTERMSSFLDTDYKGVFEDKSMLLWTTIDYDGDEIASAFLERSDYTRTQVVFENQTLKVYLCE